MAEVHVLDHPLIQHKLAILRSKDTPWWLLCLRFF